MNFLNIVLSVMYVKGVITIEEVIVLNKKLKGKRVSDDVLECISDVSEALKETKNMV